MTNTATIELVKLSAVQMAELLRSKEVSSRDLVNAELEVIDAAEPTIKAFLKVAGEAALEQADAFDNLSDAEKAELPELAGVPIAIKDMIVTKGIETTAASRILEGWVPPYDATVIEKLKAAHMPLLGRRTSMSSRRAPPPSIPPTSIRPIRGMSSACPAAPAAAPRLP